MSRRLLRHFHLYQVNGNNHLELIHLFPGRTMPRALELSSINRPLVRKAVVSRETFPTELDRPNDPSRPPLRFRYW